MKATKTRTAFRAQRKSCQLGTTTPIEQNIGVPAKTCACPKHGVHFCNIALDHRNTPTTRPPHHQLRNSIAYSTLASNIRI